MINVDMNFFFKIKLLKIGPTKFILIILSILFSPATNRKQENNSVVSQENNNKIQSILQLVN